MTPRKAIKQECCFCMNTPVFHGCSSETCQLNNTELSNLQKIKAHCIDCVPEHNVKGVRGCTGKVTSPTPHICPLHPYRLGKNPKRAGIGRKGGNPKIKTLTHGRFRSQI